MISGLREAVYQSPRECSYYGANFLTQISVLTDCLLHSLLHDPVQLYFGITFINVLHTL